MHMKTANSRQRIAEYYDETWSQYSKVWSDNQNHALHFGYWDSSTSSHPDSLVKTNVKMASLLTLRPGMDVLDAGCGVGGTAMWLAENYRVKVRGLTISEKQIALGRRYVRGRGLDDLVSLHLADYCDTGLPDESFDVVWAQESLCHAPAKEAFLREAHRLLRPNGQLIIADYFRTARDWTERSEDELADWLRCWIIDDIPTIGEFRTLVTDSSFVDVAATDISGNVYRSIKHLKGLAAAKLVVGWPKRMLKPQVNRVRHANVLGAYRQGRTFEKRLWNYNIVTAVKS
ncbi:SAM-dependent methyltransferase [Nocardia asteroides]